MRIVMIAPFATHPKGTFRIRILPIAKRLHKNGHNITIVVPPYDNISQSGLEYEIDGVHVQNIIFTDIPVLKYFLTLLRIVKKTIAFKPDVIYFFKPKGYSGLAAMFISTLRYLRLLRKIRLILDTDDWEGYGGFCDLYMKYSIYPKYVLDFFNFQERWIPKRMDAITVASVALKEQMLMNNIASKKIFYVPNGASEQPYYLSNDPEVLKLRSNLGLGNSPTILLYTRFFEYNLRQFVSIVKQVSDERSNVKFIVVGKGEFQEDEELKKLLASERLEKFVTMVGWIDLKEIPKYLALADVAIYPFDDTLLNRAKCPGKLIELMEAEKPIVAHEVGQIKEYIENEISGILVKSNNDDHNFSAQILRLLTDHSLRKKLSHNAKMQITTRFSWDDIIRTVEQALIDRS
jgi:glycosyltransferase involved in cell wall biosynthesis